MSEKITRREIIKRAVYVTPAILTLAAVPAFAKGGSGSLQWTRQGIPQGPPYGIPPGPPDWATKTKQNT